MPTRPLLYLIDGHAVAYRQFHALPEAVFSTKNGEITNAVYGFTRIVLDILLDKRPKYLAISFDAGLSGRDLLYGEYKATREKMPDSLRQQMQRIEQVVQAFNIPIMRLEGYEADDVIGSVVRQAEEDQIDVLIVTGDRDILQLLSPRVRVQLPGGKGKAEELYDVAYFVTKYGLQPQQLVDLKALMGDSSDNIPGVKGIGEKTGTTLLQKYETLDGVYAHIDEISGSVKQKLIEGKESAYLSRDLARIRNNVPVTLNLRDCVAHDFDYNTVTALFRELEFRTLFDRLESFNLTQLPLFSIGNEDAGLPEPAELVDTRLVQDQATLSELVAILEQSDGFVWDVETTALDQMQAELVGIAIACDEQTGWYIPVGHRSGEQLALEPVIDALRVPMTENGIPKFAHNALYDLIVMQRYGIDTQPVTFDSMLAEWVRDPISRFLGLKSFARQYLNVSMTNIDELLGKGKKKITMADVPIKHAAAYAAADAVMTYRAVRFLMNELQQAPAPEAGKLSAMEILEQIEMPLVPVIADMQRNGVLLDVPYLSDMSSRLDVAVQALEQEIYELGGKGTFNINSPKQLNDVLFDSLKLSVQGLEKTQHGFSTDSASLALLKHAHPIITRIEEYRELTKLKGTYVDALPELVNPRTGRVHTSYNQTGTSTGRFSSSNPNLQNIPIRTEMGREVRRAFIAPQGYHLVAVDYSQIELRVMAHVSGDATLIAAFEAGQDIHRATAAAVYGVPAQDVTDEMRGFAKRVNFGLMYGMGHFRLARESNLTVAEAEAFVKRYFQRIPGVERYLEETKQFAQQHGYVETLIGRRRYFPGLKDNRASQQRIGGEIRAAINMPIQGTAADILKIAMIRLHRELAASGLDARMILQVHDELVLEVEESAVEQTIALVLNVMQTAFPLRVPLVANAEVGVNWRDMTPIGSV